MRMIWTATSSACSRKTRAPVSEIFAVGTKSVKKVDVVGEYASGLSPAHRQLLRSLEGLIGKTAPDADLSFKWRQPWWSDHGLLCTIYEAGDHVNLGFSRGAELDDPEGILEGTGKGMRHIKIFGQGDVRKTVVTRLIRQAVRLNRESHRK
jgi:hypothetical protein